LIPFHTEPAELVHCALHPKQNANTTRRGWIREDAFGQSTIPMV
jgi:hypothetical protein